MFYSLKQATTKLLQPLLKFLMNFHPDTLTAASFIFSLCSGLCFLLSTIPGLLILAIPFILLRMAMNVLDGMLARQKGIFGPKGEAFSEMTDRFSDLALLLGITFSGYTDKILGLSATISVLIVSYIGILAKAVGANRQFGGFMGKVDRMVYMILAAIIQFIVIRLKITLPIFNLLMAFFIFGSIVTFIQRAFSINKELDRKGRA